MNSKHYLQHQFYVFILNCRDVLFFVVITLIQGGTMGICDFELCPAIFPLLYEGSYTTKIMGKCASKLPRLPSWFIATAP